MMSSPAPLPSQASVVSIPSAWLVTWQIKVYSPTSLLPALREAADSCAAERNHLCQAGVIHAVSSITHNRKTTFKIRNEEAHDGCKVQAYLFITRFIEGFFPFSGQRLCFFLLFSLPASCRASAICSRQSLNPPQSALSRSRTGCRSCWTTRRCSACSEALLRPGYPDWR